MGVLPLTGNRYHIVWTAPHNEAKALQTLDELEFLRKLEYLHRWIPGQTDPRQRATAVFRCSCFRVSINVRSRLALVGDCRPPLPSRGGTGAELGHSRTPLPWPR